MWGNMWGSTEKRRYRFSWEAYDPSTLKRKEGRISTEGYTLEEAMREAERRIENEWNYHGWKIRVRQDW